MTAKERKEFNKQLDDIAWKTALQANDVCASITIPLEIEALERMEDAIHRVIEVKKHMLNKINEKDKP